jgi:predicted Zn-dependent protease
MPSEKPAPSAYGIPGALTARSGWKGSSFMKRQCSIPTVVLLFLALFSCSEVSKWFVSDEEEVNMGTDFYHQILAQDTTYPVLDTVGNTNARLLAQYIDSIGTYVATHQTARPENGYLKYVFTVIDNDSVINAFAIPGGYVFVYTGLIKQARNEAEIAGVLAHEIAHITQRHGVEQLVKLMGVDYVKQLIFGDDPNLIADIVTSLVFLKFSRENEFESDSCAIEFLITGGYNPNGMKTFLQLLSENSGWTFEPLSTHPETAKRVEAADRIIAGKTTPLKDIAPPPNKAVTMGWILK